MTLERRYRRLLACFPWEHRRRYEQEMLGVLLDDANPGQRRPSAREVLDLLQGAARARVRYAVTDYTDQRWREAVAVLSLLAPLAMLAYTIRPILLDLLTRAWSNPGELLQWHSVPRAVAWIAVVALVLAERRAAAAAGSWVAAGLEAVRAADEYFGDPWGIVHYSVHALWPLVLALLAGAALTATARQATTTTALLGRARLGRARLGRARLGLLGGAAALGATAPSIDLIAYRAFGALGGSSGTLRTAWIFTHSTHYLEALLLGVGFTLGLCAVLGTPAPIRRRILALLAPVAATLALTRIGFTELGFLARPFGGAPASLLPGQLVALALTPLLTLAGAAFLVRRREQTLRLLALGRQADRQRPARVDKHA